MNITRVLQLSIAFRIIQQISHSARRAVIPFFIKEKDSGLASVKSATAPFTDITIWKSGANLNDLTISGFYPIGTSPTNAPTGWGILFVIGVRQDTLEQLFFSNGNVYIREARNNVWTTWKQLSA